MKLSGIKSVDKLHTFTLLDRQHQAEWQELLGFELKGPNVVVNDMFYRDNLRDIHDIQFRALGVYEK